MDDDFLEKDSLADFEIRQLFKTKEGKFAFLAFVMKENIEMSLAEMFVYLNIDPPPKKQQEEIVDLFIKNVLSIPFGIMFEKMKMKKDIFDKVNDELKKEAEKYKLSDFQKEVNSWEN